MEIGVLKITGEHCYDDIALFINDNYDVGYEKELAQGKIFFIENYSWLANSEMMIAIAIQRIDSSIQACEIEIIAGGGGTGIFNIGYGNESRRVGQFYDAVSRFCEENSFSMEEVERN